MPGSVGQPVAEPEFLVPDWPAPARVGAAFSLRSGGISAGRYASLNVGAHVGDAPAAVAENRFRLREALGLPAEPLWLEQVHGSAVARFDGRERPVADAAVACEAGQVCAVMVADCLPVLLADRAGSCVGIAHAGWRGLAAGVIEATIAALPASAGSLMAWLGPAIGPEAFEVGAEVRERLVADDPAARAEFRPGREDRWYADLYGLARRRLAAAGVSAVHGGDCCTLSDPERFFSYRRDGVTGRMAALIWLRR
jgi:YfiH family protein